MTNLKKLLAAFLAVCVVMSTAACSDNAQNNSDGTADVTTTAVIENSAATTDATSVDTAVSVDTTTNINEPVQTTTSAATTKPAQTTTSKPSAPIELGTSGFTRELSNKNANAETKELYSYICSQFGSKIISGQQESTWMDSDQYEFDYIESVSGKLPAIRGLDYMNDDFDGVNERAIAWHERGGIVTICWHCGPEFSKSYDECMNDEIADWNKTLTEGTDEYNAFVAGMDKAAKALLELQDAGVPVLWRPFHEYDGGWFWWSKGGAENFKKLWNLMYDRFTNYWGLNNLIWVAGASHSISKDWTLDNSVVDIAGGDTYDNTEVPMLFKKVKAFYGDNIPLVLHENGTIPDPDYLQEKSINWVWFMTWHTQHITDSKNNTTENIKKVYNSDYVITLDELPWNK